MGTHGLLSPYAVRDIGLATLLGVTLTLAASEPGMVAAGRSAFYSCLADPSFWLCVAVLSLPYIMFYFIWKRPRAWMGLCRGAACAGFGATDGERAVGVFAFMGMALKVVQFAAVLVWWCGGAAGTGIGAGLGDLASVVLATTAPRAVAAAALMGAGQALNGAVYAHLGSDGVYYGFKLGRTVPWCHAFPFNTGLRHPQYVGSVLSIWSMVIMLMTPANAGVATVGLAWSFQYLVTSSFEEVGDADGLEPLDIKEERAVEGKKKA
jgi:hypothetical protein